MDQWAFVVSDDENTIQKSRKGSITSSSSTDTSDTSPRGSSGSSSEASSLSKSIIEVTPECHTPGREIIRIPELVDEPPTLVRRPARATAAKAKTAEATRCSDESLSELRSHFLVPDDVEFLLPSPSDRASSPPEGYFTLYEAFFYETYLWFPIPSVIFEFLDMYSIAISQLMPRSMRHLVGLIIRSYEEKVELTARYIDALVQFSTKNDHYFLSARAHRQVIKDFPNKDTYWWKWFFYVRKSEASVCSEALHLVRSDHSPIGSFLSRF